jgi:DNA invertase Pin-like site-specific DNA recombinase
VDLVAYLRVSSESQLDGYGLDIQAKACERWAKSQGHRIVKVCSDDGVSGMLDAADRPGLACALDALEDGIAQGLVVGRLDRLARKLHVQEAALAAAWRQGATVFTVDSGEVHKDDADDPMRTAIRQMMGVFAQLDRSQVVKRLRDGRRAKAAAGRHAVGQYAYGMQGVGKGKERDAGENPGEIPALARIVELRRGGQSYRQIALQLDSEGLKPRRAEHWSAMAVRNIAQRAGVA